MTTEPGTCTACFPDRQRPQCRKFDTSEGALGEYGHLHRGGLVVFMCQQSDRGYRVCHQPEATVASIRYGIVRAA